MTAGGVDLAAADAPAVGAAAGDGARQAATRRGAQVRLDAQGVDQRTFAYRLFGNLYT